VPSLIEGLRVVQGLQVVPVFLYRYTMQISLKKARSPGTTERGRSDEALATHSGRKLIRQANTASDIQHLHRAHTLYDRQRVRPWIPPSWLSGSGV